MEKEAFIEKFSAKLEEVEMYLKSNFVVNQLKILGDGIKFPLSEVGFNMITLNTYHYNFELDLYLNLLTNVSKNSNKSSFHDLESLKNPLFKTLDKEEFIFFVREKINHIEVNMKENFPSQQWPLIGYETINVTVALQDNISVKLNEHNFDVWVKMNLFGDLY